MNKLIFSSLSGAIFGLGLTLSGMVNPDKILAFLDMAGNWDPSLLIVLASAVATTTAGYALLRYRQKPVFDSCFYLPRKETIDRRLLLGAVIFGAGWGLAGYCPGPVIASLGFGKIEPFIFLSGLLAGSFVAAKINNREMLPND